MYYSSISVGLKLWLSWQSSRFQHHTEDTGSNPMQIFSVNFTLRKFIEQSDWIIKIFTNQNA